MKVKTIVVEDEQHCIDRILKLIKKHENILDLLVVVNSVSEAKSAIEEFKPDLVFLDIQLGKETSFELLEQLDTIDFDMIFTTAYNHFAIQAIRLSALDYLMKPLQEKEFDEALQKVEKVINRKQHEAIELLLHNYTTDSLMKKKIAIPCTTGIVFVEISEIIRLKADGGYAHFIRKDKSQIIATKPLKHFQEMLSEDMFFRTHKTHIVSRTHVQEYIKADGGYARMSNDDEVPIAVMRKQEFLEWLQR